MYSERTQTIHNRCGSSFVCEGKNGVIAVDIVSRRERVSLDKLLPSLEVMESFWVYVYGCVCSVQVLRLRFVPHISASVGLPFKQTTCVVNFCGF